MQSNNIPVHKEIVLVGGGHAHALLIRQWGMQPLPGVRLTLVSPAPNTPYSGMLPGLIAGHYSFEELHIDLVKLCHWARMRFICSEVTGLDPASQQVTLKDQPALAYDVLSINTGSTPDDSVPGVAEHAIPIKPIAGFWQRWQQLREQLERTDEQLRITVVGGGAGSVEAILAMAWSCRNNRSIHQAPVFQLVSQGAEILSGYPRQVRRAAEQACQELDIHIETSFSVIQVTKDRLISAEDKHLACDQVIWCAQAGAPDWPTESGLACTEDGFVEVNEFLQSSSHDSIFAAGDVAHMIKSPRPKAGVYAVRQAPVLFNNLCNYSMLKPLLPYRPQDKFLSLLTLGGKVATGNRGSLSISGKWVWRWKDRIDRKFMGRFQSLVRNGSNES